MRRKVSEAQAAQAQSIHCITSMIQVCPDGEVKQKLLESLTHSKFAATCLQTIDLATGTARAAGSAPDLPPSGPPAAKKSRSGPPAPPASTSTTAQTAQGAEGGTAPAQEEEEEDVIPTIRDHTFLCPPKLQCYCGVQCVDPADFSNHYQTHTSKKYQCVTCGNIFADKRGCWKHFRTQHLHKCIHTCPIEGCDKGFNGAPYCHDEEPLVRNHMANEHGIATNVKCSKCGIGFATKKSRNNHEGGCEGSLNLPKRFVCTIGSCTKRYTTRKALDEHKLSHSGEGQKFVCPTCGKSYSSSSACKFHMSQKKH